MKLSTSDICKAANCSPTVADALLVGVSKSDLQSLFGVEMSLPADDPQVDVARMNTVGSLRALGYEVSGGRQGRSVPYKILGWSPIDEYLPAETWQGPEREVLDEILLGGELRGDEVEQWKSRIQFSISGLSPAFESSVDYLSTYEMARDRAFEMCHGRAIVLWRFPNMPRLRIFNLGLDVKSLDHLAQWLSKASLTRVRVVIVNESDAGQLRNMGWEVTRHRQALYDPKWIMDNLNSLFSKTQRSLLRQHERQSTIELAYGQLRPREVSEATALIQMWKATNEKKQRQLAIGRDFRAVEIGTDLAILVRRLSGELVALQLLGRSITRVASQLVEKALNYRHMPGGQSGTSDFSFVHGLDQLRRMLGYRVINGGDIDGGTVGLAEHKLKLCNGKTFTSYVAFAPYKPLDRTRYRKGLS